MQDAIQHENFTFYDLNMEEPKLTSDMKLKKLCDPIPNHEWNGDHIVFRMVH